MGRVDERVERFAAAVEVLKGHHPALTSKDGGLAAADCTAALEVVARAEGVLAGIKAGLLLAYQASGKLGANGDKDLAGYAGRTLNRGRAGGRKDATLARGLATLHDTRRDLVEGAITPAHAQILADTLERASQVRKDALLDRGGQEDLLAAARRQDVGEFAKTVRRWEHTTDRAQADATAEAAHRARNLRTLTRRDGCVKVDGLLDPVGGQALLVALDAVTPTKLATDDERTGEQRRADALVDLAILANRGGTVKPGSLAPTQVVVHMPARTLAQGLAEQLLQADAPAPARADQAAAHERGLSPGDSQVGGLVNDEATGPVPKRGVAGSACGGAPDMTGGGCSVGGHRAARDPSGEPIFAGSVRSDSMPWSPPRGEPRYEPPTLEGGFPFSLASAMMLVCDSALMRLVVDADGVPLDVGRSQRVWAKEQRLAIFARDQGCRYPGCGRPTRWCEVHHIHTWADGGVTSIDNGITLCRAHHTLIHNEAVRITSIAGGFRFTARTGLTVGENHHATTTAPGSSSSAHPRDEQAPGTSSPQPRAPTPRCHQ